MFPLQPIVLEAAVLVLGMLLLIFEAFADEADKRFFAWCGVSGLLLVLVLSFFTVPPPAVQTAGFWSFYAADPLALFFKRFALLTTTVVLVMAIDYRATVAKFTGSGTGDDSGGVAEFFALPVLTCAGLMWMASAIDFVMIFVSLELVTISFYILVSYLRRNLGSLEAGVKYLILGALSTGFLVYGITWIYGLTGQTNLSAISDVLATGGIPRAPLLFGVLLVLAGLGFKIAAFPFQIWVPDVYQGAPTPITAFLSVGSKAAGFVVLMRVLDAFASAPAIHQTLLATIAVLAAATLLYGNLAALPQNNLKRLLAYSSIAHAGYLLVGVAAVSGDAVSFYLAGYLLMTLLAFLVMVIVHRETGGDHINDFRGLGKRSPFLAFAMMISMVSLAGLPFTAGFLGKFFIFAAAIEQQMWLLVGIGAISVAAGFYYYLKVVRAMYWLEGEREANAIAVSPLSKATICALCALIVLFGVLPGPILAMLR